MLGAGLEPALPGIEVYHQPERSGKAQLKTHIPEDVGISQGHENGRGEQPGWSESRSAQ